MIGEGKELIEIRERQVREAIEKIPFAYAMAEAAAKEEEKSKFYHARIKLEAEERIYRYFTSLIKSQAGKGLYSVRLVKGEDSWNVPSTSEIRGSLTEVVDKNLEDYPEFLPQLVKHLESCGYSVTYKVNESIEINWAPDKQGGKIEG